MYNPRNFLLGFLGLLLSYSLANAATLTVDQGGGADFTSIQPAINAAQDGDTVVIAPGTYFENITIPAKTLVLSSTNPDDPAVVAGTIMHGVNITSIIVDIMEGGSAPVQFSGLTIAGARMGVQCVGRTLKLLKCTIQGNMNYGGIYCEDSHTILRNCTIAENMSGSFDERAGGVSCAGGSILLDTCLVRRNSGFYSGGIATTDTDLTITNCTVSENSDYGFGYTGGIGCLGGSTVISGSTIMSNDGAGAGGIGFWSAGGALAISDSTVSGNYSDADYLTAGGGIWVRDGIASMVHCMIHNNITAGGGAGIAFENSFGSSVKNCLISENQGGVGFSAGVGVACDGGSVEFASCTVSDNHARYFGGGLYSRGSSITMLGCSVTGNSALNYGGGGIACSGGSLTVVGCKVTGNATADALYGGGGAYFSGVSVTAQNCLFAGNSVDGADGDGGGLFLSGATMVAGNCTLAGNLAASGGGLSCDSSGGSSPSTVNIFNSIVWDEGNDILNNDNSIINISYSDMRGGYPGEGIISQDPLFADGAYHLSAGSPCIDAGDNTAMPAEVTTDLDGKPRYVEDPATVDVGNGTPPIVDMGAYEYFSAFFIEIPGVMPATCRFEIPVYINNTEDVLGLSFGLSHDPESMVLEDILRGAACSTCSCRDFIADQLATCLSGEVGGTVGIVFDAGCSLSPGRHEIARFVYRSKKQGLAAVKVVGCLGSPPVEVVLTSNAGSVIPTFMDSSVELQRSCLMPGRGILEPPKEQPNITDVIWILRCLFGIDPGKCPACLDVADVDDDGGFDILDPVYLIDYLFRKGPPPPPPFPGCGFDLTEDGFSSCRDVSCAGI